MGYDGALLLASAMLFLPILAIAGLVFFLLRRLGFVPSGVAAIPAYGLIVLGGYAMLFLGSAFQMLVLDPAALQKHHLGQAYGTPLTLRSYAHSGFQDPMDEWTYALEPKVVAELRQRCLPDSEPGRCSLYSNMDERTFASVRLEGNMLYLADGLH